MIVVTGSSGLLGRSLISELVSHGFNVIAIDRRHDRGSLASEQHVIDLSKPRKLSTIFRGVAAVVHLAGNSHPTARWPSVLRDNIAALQALYETARRTGVRRIIFASSNRVTEGYEGLPGWQPAPPTKRGGIQSPFPLSSVSPPRPLSTYAVSKLFGEAIGRLYLERYSIETLCIRIGSVTQTDRPSEERHQITWLSKRDFCSMVVSSLKVQDFGGYAILYAGSKNARAVWDLDEAAGLLGWVPLDHAATNEVHRYTGADHDLKRGAREST